MQRTNFLFLIHGNIEINQKISSPKLTVSEKLSIIADFINLLTGSS